MNLISNPTKSGEEAEEVEPEELIHQGSESTQNETEGKEETASIEEPGDREDSVVMEETPKGKFAGDSLIGEVIEMCPRAESILEKHFGACANCPAIAKETIVFQVSIHKVDLKLILDELNQLCQ